MNLFTLTLIIFLTLTLICFLDFVYLNLNERELIKLALVRLTNVINACFVKP